MLAPLVEKLQDQFPGIAFAKVDTTEAEELARELGVGALPALKLYVSGREAGAPVVGYKPKLLAEAVARLAKEAGVQ